MMKVIVKKRKKCKKGHCRIMCLAREAVYELLREQMYEEKNVYFDLPDKNDAELAMRWNYETGAFVCVAYTRKDQPQIDFDRIEKSLGMTTSTIFTDRKRYRELPLTAVAPLQFE